jgi:DNA-binding MarR family transcriptional regulator/GNAT superfamily N-acetyltransferase
MEVSQIAQVRRFSRTVTQRIGVLNDAYLARDRPLGQSRVLWEIGPEGIDVRALRARLDLDSGYVSRLLRALEADGLVRVDAHGGDARVRTARLTEAGLAERAVLDDRSDELAASILDALAPDQRDRLAAAMAEVERLLVASTVTIEVQDPRDPDARTCLRTYFQELVGRFEAGFDPALSVGATDADLSPPAGLFLVATRHGEPVGCGGLRLPGGEPAQIKRMWVAPTTRGLGLGRRLLGELEARAQLAGAGIIQLETNQALTEAIALYRSAGYQEIAPFNDEPYAHHWFSKQLA